MEKDYHLTEEEKQKIRAALPPYEEQHVSSGWYNFFEIIADGIIDILK